MVVEISLTKKLEKAKRTNKGKKTNRSMPIFIPTIQLVIVNLYIKFEVSILNGSEDIFDEKSGEKEKTNIEKNN